MPEMSLGCAAGAGALEINASDATSAADTRAGADSHTLAFTHLERQAHARQSLEKTP